MSVLHCFVKFGNFSISFIVATVHTLSVCQMSTPAGMGVQESSEGNWKKLKK